MSALCRDCMARPADPETARCPHCHSPRLVRHPELDAVLRDVSARLFVGMEGASFGRCDIRVDKDGVPFILEINANCGVYYPPADAGGADLCLLHDPGGHEAFTRQLIRAALARASSS